MGYGIDIKAIMVEYLAASEATTVLGTLSSTLSDSALTFTLNSGFTELDSGFWPVKIEDEYVYARNSGTAGTFTIDTGGRGFFNTVAAEHLANTQVELATFAEVLGGNFYEIISEEDFKNESPGCIWAVTPGQTHQTVEKYEPRTMVKLYGGKDSRGNRCKIAPDVLYRLLERRILGMTSKEVLSSGVVVGAEIEFGQTLLDDKKDEVWPFSYSFVQTTVRGKSSKE